MNPISPEGEVERIEEEASVWAARLRGGAMTDADRAALAQWLAQDPGHREALARYRELTVQLDAHFGPGAEPVVEAEFERPRPWRRWMTIGAAAAAMVTVAFVFAGRTHEFSTKTAERHLAALADGSRVELNARTVLAVDFNRSERRVRLTRGEALFTVAKDTARPFVVQTPAGGVRVTGTVFNVRATSSQGAVEVTVLEGVVRVQPARAAEREVTLTTDTQVQLRSDRADWHPLRAGAAQEVVAWRQGQAVFEDTRLAEAVERFSAYNTQRVQLEAATADLRLGGRFSLDDLDGFLDFVQRALPVRVSRRDGTVLISAQPEK